MAERLFQTYMLQVFQDGFVHVDPPPDTFSFNPTQQNRAALQNGRSPLSILGWLPECSQNIV
ncbi:MAG: hypothetical protein ACNA8H_13990 [Anaerolineales bacterium]